MLEEASFRPKVFYSKKYLDDLHTLGKLRMLTTTATSSLKVNAGGGNVRPVSPADSFTGSLGSCSSGSGNVGRDFDGVQQGSGGNIATEYLSAALGLNKFGRSGSNGSSSGTGGGGDMQTRAVTRDDDEAREVEGSGSVVDQEIVVYIDGFGRQYIAGEEMSFPAPTMPIKPAKSNVLFSRDRLWPVGHPRLKGAM
ncbi:hypothetical protein HDU76_005278 [Blyttiomyces sp. JEL0837]|nr:hypothetical protein HDU76_005278 [Blyttiomyces sp. JEL0837]